MKKSGLLNAELSRIVASLGHGDRLVIADAGLPIPPGVPVIDLAVTLGVPRFQEVLEAVLREMQVERAEIAAEAAGEVRGWVAALGPDETDHEAFKAANGTARAIVRTGEGTPYANIALISGVVF